MDISVDNRKNQKRKIYTDGIRAKKIGKAKVSLDGLRRPAQKDHQGSNSILLARNGSMDSLRVKNPQKYIATQKQRREMCRQQYIKAQQSLDGVGVHNVKKNPVKQVRQEEVQRENIIQNTYNAFAQYRNALQFSISPTRVWQLSLTGAMIFGMVSMSLIYRNLGQSAFAKDAAERALAVVEEEQVVQMIDEKVDEKEEKVQIVESDVEIEENVKKDAEFDEGEKVAPVVMADIVEKEQVVQIAKDDVEAEETVTEKKSVDGVTQKVEEEKSEDEEVEKTLEDLAYETVEGFPIEKMLPYILEQDPEVAKYLIAIAKQESAWGKRVPVLNGQDCYNYWGYRGTRKLMGSGGHTCFNSRKDAVETVGKRINDLVYEYDRKTADRLIVWKCGSSCAGHSQEGVDRWIGVVDTYYQRLSKAKK